MAESNTKSNGPGNEAGKEFLEQENQEWLESIDYVFKKEGPDRVKDIFRLLQTRAQGYGVSLSCPGTTPYINTIPASQQPPFPGNREVERRIKSIIRWNAMAMVVRANRVSSGIGGHISTYMSLATLLEVAFNHFLHGKGTGEDGTFHYGDIVYFQGHAVPGVYARAFLEGRLSEQDLINFRRELRPEGGLSSYPHPWLMPGFWEYPTVSMGLSPLMAIYQARFNHYLRDRGLQDTGRQKIWAFLGDGEMDEPEALGALTLAGREKLDNLIFVINCNLQRLDGPVRGNSQIVQELEGAFRGAGWNVIKVLWGSDFDPLFARDETGVFARHLDKVLDGQLQKYAVSTGDYIRRNFFGQDPALLELVKNYSDEQLRTLRRGGHDPEKVYAAYKAAVEHTGQPTVILALTIKGYGLGEAGEGRNITHQQKKLNMQELVDFRNRFSIPVSDEKIDEAPFYRPPEDSEEIKYLRARRRELGGFVPQREVRVEPLKTPADELFAEFYEGSGEREVATTMVLVRILAKLLLDREVGQWIVPIIPDEARTFGLEALFRQFGIYSSRGQLYEPVDKDSLLYYNEKKNGVILEEGITEAGSLSSFIAAGTAYAAHGINMIPFFLFYSMFGFQRVGDLIWAAADARTKGFLIGGTAGRTTLPGEGLQHQDGQSHHYVYAVPNLKAYDPCFAYEMAVIVRDGIYRMYEKQEDIFYYITMMNETYTMPAMPEGVRDGILKGMYRYKASDLDPNAAKVHLFGSGAILREAIKAKAMLEEKYRLPTEVWSVTSYKELYTDIVRTERWNRLHPDEEPRKPYLSQCLEGTRGVYVAALDYMRTLPLSVAAWFPGRLNALGTDGFGRSEDRESLRDYFEVDAKSITLAALYNLARDKELDISVVKQAMAELGINPEKAYPFLV